MEIVSLHIGFVHGLQNVVDVSTITKGNHLQHVLMMVELDYDLIKNIKHIRSIVLGLCLVFYSDILEVAHRIKAGVTKQSAHIGILATYLDVINKGMNGFV